MSPPDPPGDDPPIRIGCAGQFLLVCLFLGFFLFVCLMLPPTSGGGKRSSSNISVAQMPGRDVNR